MTNIGEKQVYRGWTGTVIGIVIWLAYLGLLTPFLVWGLYPIAILLAVVCAGFAWIGIHLIIKRLEVTAEGVFVRNFAKTTTLRWASIRKFDAIHSLVVIDDSGKQIDCGISTLRILRPAGAVTRADELAAELNWQLAQKLGIEQPVISGMLPADRRKLRPSSWLLVLALAAILAATALRTPATWLLIPAAVVAIVGLVGYGTSRNN